MGSVGQQQQPTAGAASGGGNGELAVYVKAGVDGERMGACPFCQRVLMVLLIKSQHNLLRFKVITTNPAKPPPEFKALGLKHVPALIHGDDGFDALDDIIHYLDTKFPGGGLEYNSSEADIATKDFFSKFCFYIKAVNQDPSKLDQALERLNNFLEKTHITNGVTNGDAHLQADEDESSSGAGLQALLIPSVRTATPAVTAQRHVTLHCKDLSQSLRHGNTVKGKKRPLDLTVSVQGSTHHTTWYYSPTSDSGGSVVQWFSGSMVQRFSGCLNLGRPEVEINYLEVVYRYIEFEECFPYIASSREPAHQHYR
ncbi:chloride intracellular channel protein 5-like [Penaeus japonicus]|uniref:chloride intracellular channel protein 5-like n=1 Tax=Penaeus japonicus TaxID=27405 RepID=UPI001C712881|nr:chloride intracellular channel protein 5-like [Penaeus japonicus]